MTEFNPPHYTLCQPLSLSPAPGWRAAYITDIEHDPSIPDEEVGWSAESLIAWGVFNVVTTTPAEPAPQGQWFEGKEIHGVVLDEEHQQGVSACGGGGGSFWRYLPPGDEPSESEFEAELKRRREELARRSS